MLSSSRHFFKGQVIAVSYRLVYCATKNFWHHRANFEGRRNFHVLANKKIIESRFDVFVVEFKFSWLRAAGNFDLNFPYFSENSWRAFFFLESTASVGRYELKPFLPSSLVDATALLLGDSSSKSSFLFHQSVAFA